MIIRSYHQCFGSSTDFTGCCVVKSEEVKKPDGIDIYALSSDLSKALKTNWFSLLRPELGAPPIQAAPLPDDMFLKKRTLESGPLDDLNRDLKNFFDWFISPKVSVEEVHDVTLPNPNDPDHGGPPIVTVGDIHEVTLPDNVSEILKSAWDYVFNSPASIEKNMEKAHRVSLPMTCNSVACGLDHRAVRKVDLSKARG